MKKKIVIVATYYGNSGASHSLIKLSEELIEHHDCEVTVICPRVGFVVDKLKEKKINYKIYRYYPWVIDINKKRKMFEKVKWNLKKIINSYSELLFNSYIKTNKPDIIHINASTSSFGAKVALNNDIGLIWHFREFVEEDLQKQFWNEKKSYKLLSQANYQIAISNSVKYKFQKKLNKNNLKVVYNGIDNSMYKKIMIKKNDTKKHRLIVMGRILPKKGQLEAIQAVGIIVSKYKLDNISLEIVGGIENIEYFNLLKEEVTNLNLENICTFFGEVANPLDYLDEAEISLVCSEAEAFGRVTVESIFRNTFVLGKNTAGTAELLEDENILYSGAEDLAEKLYYYLTNKNEMYQLLSQMKEKFYEKYKSSNNSLMINEIYLEYIKEIKKDDDD